jgi:uncharacterized spore protein YtfJ
LSQSGSQTLDPRVRERGEAVQRPAGVTIIAILALIFGAAVALAGLLLLLRSRVDFVGDMSFYGGAGAFAGIVLVAIAALVIVTSLGLLGLHEWARVLMIVLNAVHLVVATLGLLDAFRNIHTLFFFGVMLRHIVMIAIAVWIIVYLIQPRVKQAFRPAAPVVS